MQERRNQLDQLNAIVQEQSRLAADEKSNREAEAQRKFASESAKILEANPDWANHEVYTAESNKIFEYMGGHGIGKEEVTALVLNNHRFAKVLRDAAAFRALQAKK